jgi:hypothetical protein
MRIRATAVILLSLGLAMLAAGAKFWETKPPEEWTPEEVDELLTNSPWAQVSGVGRPNAIPMYLASAEPMRIAEQRKRAMRKTTGASDASFAEYQALLAESPNQYVVLAILPPKREALADGDFTRRLEKDSKLRSGGASYPVYTYFPPSSTDPYLRVVFHRPPSLERGLQIAVYVPGVHDGYRQLVFNVKEMVFRGKPAY